MNQQVKYQQSATLSFQSLKGRPSSPTITIKTRSDLDLKTAVSAEDATVDPVDTTVDAASGASQDNPRLVRLASTSDVRVDGRYRIVGDEGTEWVEVMAIKAGDYVTARNPLVHDYESGDAFQGTRLTYALAADNAQNRDDDCDVDFRCEWAFTVDGTDYVRETLYDVTRHPWFRAASAAGLKRWNSELFSRWEEEGDVDWEAELDEAFDQIIRMADARGWRPGALIGMDHLAVPTYWQLAYSKALGGMSPPHAVDDPDAWIDRCQAGLGRAMDLAESNITWIDKDQDNVKDEAETGTYLRVQRWSP